MSEPQSGDEAFGVVGAEYGDAAVERAFRAEVIGRLEQLAKSAPPPAPVFIQLRNARDQPIAIDRAKVLAVESLGDIRAPMGGEAAAGTGSAEYCNVYLAMLDQPLVVRGTEEEVVAALEGESAYDPTAPGEREAFQKLMSHPRVSADLDRLAEAREIAARQAEDARLWFLDPTPEEDYLQRALRELTEAIEGKSGEECAHEVLAGGKEGS